MSKVINNLGVKPGTIYRIALENFVTYKQVELYPDTALNLIIGPNGTGKSTFVCAIILGLCGKTSVIGRSKKLSDYVRSSCEEASIELELYGEPGKRNIIITRHFTLEGVSTWFINNKTVKEKQVQELIATMNIQVDNLCQLLPQDRVQDFSKLDAQQLLKSTLLAVGGQRAVQQLEDLIQSRNEQRELGSKTSNKEQVLQEHLRINERLKVTIDAMQQRQELENQMSLCDKKRLWLQYEEMRLRVNEYTKDKENATKLVESHKQKIAPFEAEIQEVRDKIHVVEQTRLGGNREIHSLRDKVNGMLRIIQTKDYIIKDNEAALLEKQESHKNREREIEEAKTKLDKLITDKDKLIEIVGEPECVKKNIMELMEPIAKSNTAIEQLKKKKLEIQFDLDNNVTPQIRLHQNNIRCLEDVDKKRLEAVRRYSDDSHQAVLWFRQNKHIFKHPAYEPMLLEINFTDPKFARYLEGTIANRDLVAFTFESTADMNLFLKTVKTSLKLRMVNAVHSDPSSYTQTFDRPMPLKEISYLGFYTYLDDTITAPEAIMLFLRRQYKIHRIPIGNHHTYNNSNKVPTIFNKFFTENHRFIVRTSAYSGATSTCISEIRPATYLANTIDMEQLNKHNNNLKKFEENAKSYKDKIKTYDRQLNELEGMVNELYLRRKKISEGADKVKTLLTQIRIQAKKVEDIVNEPAVDLAEETTKCQEAQKKAVIEQVKMHSEIKNLMKTLQGKSLNSDVWQLKLEFSRNSIVERESKFRELKNELKSVESTLENIENMLVRAKQKALEKLSEAKRVSNNRLPQEQNFPYRDQYLALPSSLDELDRHFCELQTRLNCMAPGENTIIKDYEERRKIIRGLKAEIHNSTNINRVIEERMNTIREEWLPPLLQLLDSINTKFGDMFERLGCAGEIKLDRGGGDDDYDKYGIAILVKFRANEQLQQLTRHTQSGGERALTTAIYLMAIQRLSTVPFRCVDEINQGMDSVNERKMFQLLVDVTTEGDNSQYFLLTPKLLFDLKYNEEIIIHTIMNGKRILDFREWDLDEFFIRGNYYRISQAG